MYGYITQDNIVGQLFDAMPADDMYHPDIISRIVALPDSVTSGWIYDLVTGEFAPPGPEPAPEPTPDEDRDAMLVDLMTEVALLKLGIYEI